MSQFEDYLNIPDISSDTKFWMIRSKGGFFFDEFIMDGFIAIGWNLICSSDIPDNLSTTDVKKLKDAIQREYGDSVPGNALNKCIRFYKELKPDDIVMIVDHRRLAFAKVKEYYEVDGPDFTVESEKRINERIKIAAKEQHFTCPYKKRRRIEIIRVIWNTDEETINPYLYRAFAKNPHSLSDLGEYANIILGSCYDLYTLNGVLSLIFRIDQKEHISAFDLSNFITSTAIIFTNNNAKDISVKISLNSPGEIELQICNWLSDNWHLIVIGYAIIFGAKFKDVELNSIVGLVKSICDRGYERKKQKLELEGMALNNAKTAAETRAIELSNIDRERKLQLELIDDHASVLVTTAKNLEVRAANSNIIFLEKYFQTQPTTED